MRHGLFQRWLRDEQYGFRPGGGYSIGNLPADTYVVLFDPTCGGAATSADAAQYFDNVPDFAAAIASPSNEIRLVLVHPKAK